jgi:hypothetical protein
MPRKLTAGLIILSAVLIACSNATSTNGLSVGPNFSSGTLYATNSTQNGISIYRVGEASGKGPAYNIGGGSTSLNVPQFLAFDNKNNLYVTNYNQSTQKGDLLMFEALATGNVLPFGVIASSADGIDEPAGVAINPIDGQMVVANINRTAGIGFDSQLLLFTTDDATSQVSAPMDVIAGPATGMNVPNGVALNGYTAYVTNLAGASVEAFIIPTPTPTPTPPTPSPSPTPSPTATPTAPTPTPSPTPTPLNLTPALVISGGSSGVTKPSGIALDAAGNLYVSDQGNGNTVAPSILVFPSGLSGSVSSAPICKISGTNTNLDAPSDVAVDKSGNIYVADRTAAGAGVVYVFAPMPSCGNVAPTKTYTSPGIPIGLGILH